MLFCWSYNKIISRNLRNISNYERQNLSIGIFIDDLETIYNNNDNKQKEEEEK